MLSAASAEPWLTGLLARAYQAASAAFAGVGEADASWLAANRATRWAEDAGDPLAAVASGFRMGHAFLTLGRLDQAEHVAIEAIAALRPMTDEQDCPPGSSLAVRGDAPGPHSQDTRVNQRASSPRCFNGPESHAKPGGMWTELDPFDPLLLRRRSGVAPAGSNYVSPNFMDSQSTAPFYRNLAKVIKPIDE